MPCSNKHTTCHNAAITLPYEVGALTVFSLSFLIDEETGMEKFYSPNITWWVRFQTQGIRTLNPNSNLPCPLTKHLLSHRKIPANGPFRLESNMLYDIKGKNDWHRSSLCNHLVSVSYRPENPMLDVVHVLLDFTAWQRRDTEKNWTDCTWMCK